MACGRQPVSEQGDHPATGHDPDAAEPEGTRQFSRNEEQEERSGGHQQQEQAKRVDLRVVAVMKEIKNSERERFAPGRNDQQRGFHVPKRQEIDEVTGGKNRSPTEREHQMTPELTSRGPLETRGGHEIRFKGAHGLVHA